MHLSCSTCVKGRDAIDRFHHTATPPHRSDGRNTDAQRDSERGKRASETLAGGGVTRLGALSKFYRKNRELVLNVLMRIHGDAFGRKTVKLIKTESESNDIGLLYHTNNFTLQNNYIVRVLGEHLLYVLRNIFTVIALAVITAAL